MTLAVGLVDWAVIVILSVSVIFGLAEGFFRSVFSLGGLLLGLLLAAWNYSSLATLLFPLLHSQRVASTISYLLIALLVMGLASLAGKILSKFFHIMGLGCLDRLAGGVFGFFKGSLLVILAILVIAAFFPNSHWLTDAILPKYFFGACHLSTHMGPHELAEKVQQGLKALDVNSPPWMRPGGGI